MARRRVAGRCEKQHGVMKSERGAARAQALTDSDRGHGRAEPRLG